MQRSVLEGKLAGAREACWWRHCRAPPSRGSMQGSAAVQLGPAAASDISRRSSNSARVRSGPLSPAWPGSSSAVRALLMPASTPPRSRGRMQLQSMHRCIDYGVVVVSRKGMGVWLRQEMGVQDPVGFWDPLGLSADKDQADVMKGSVACIALHACII